MKKRVYKDIKWNGLSGKLGAPGSTVKKCYLSHLGKCIEPLSAEHFISKNILVQLGGFPSQGVPWLASLGIRLSPDALTVKCLCKGHNSYLSSLDTFAGEFFECAANFWKSTKYTLTISSKPLELWMLKCLCGLISTGKIKFGKKTFDQSDIKIEWLKILMGEAEFPEGQGLYIYYSVGDKIDSNKAIAIAPQFIDDELAGLLLEFRGIKFMLSLVPTKKAFKKPVKETNLLYRHFNIKNASKNSRMVVKL